MGKDRYTRESYTRATRAYVPTDGPATRHAEQKVKETGKLHPLVDPQGYGVIRRSLPRFVQREDGLFELGIGTPMPIEVRLDTTGSMGGNVDVAIRVLPDTYELSAQVLSGYDLQLAIGIFGDVSDKFVLCRPQFEMTAEKIVEQLTLMFPERAGGDFPEDPHYGLFGATYLTSTYISRIGLKGYDFTISDASARDRLDERQLIRIFGPEVFDKANENGHQINRRDLPTTKEIVQELLKRSHAFFCQVGQIQETSLFWENVFGDDRVILLPDINLLSKVQAVVIGLTEGTIDLRQISDFLKISKEEADRIIRSVANIPIGAQAVLPNFNRRPKLGDLFRNKTDVWPIDLNELKEGVPTSSESSDGSITWL